MNSQAQSKWRPAVSSNLLIGTLVMLPWLWLCRRYWDYYPLWDAAIYFESALEVFAKTLNPLAYNFAGHPTMGYLWLPGVLMRWLGQTYRVFLVYNVILGWAMAVAIADLASAILKGKAGRFEVLLTVGAVMYCPVVASSILQLTPDYGVLVFLMLATRAFVREHAVRAIGWGILASLSKESGVLVFAIEWAVYIVVYGLRAPNGPSAKLRSAYRRSLLVLIPFAGLCSAAAYVVANGSKVLWGHVDLEGVIRQFASISFMDNVLPASLATIFVLSFMWVPTLILFANWGRWLTRNVVLGLPGATKRDPAFEFIVVICVLGLLLLTRFRTFTNVRYYLPVFPLMILLAARSLLDFGWWRGVRVAVLGALVALLGLSNFRSFDPASEWMFGSMRFGQHRLFRITSLTKECCGLGRDQLVYNFEFTELDRLLRQALPFVLSSKQHVVAAHPECDWKLFDSVDPKTLRRVTPGPGTFKVPYTSTWAVAASPVKPEKIYYLAMPNMPDSSELIRYGAWYDFHWRKRRFQHEGYELDVHELTLKRPH